MRTGRDNTPCVGAGCAARGCPPASEGFESWLERDRLILLDFDPAVVGIASQPFWLFFTTAEGKRRSHAPDYFARLVDGSALVLDCRPTARIKPRDRVAFEATARACAVLGWRYEVVDAAAPVLMGNVRWLAAYRHPRHDLPAVAAALREVFAEPAGLLEGAEAVGDPSRCRRKGQLCPRLIRALRALTGAA